MPKRYPSGSIYPHDLDVAKADRKPKYWSDIECPVCHRTVQGRTLRFTKTGECFECCRLDTMDFYNMVMHGRYLYKDGSDWFIDLRCTDLKEPRKIQPHVVTRFIQYFKDLEVANISDTRIAATGPCAPEFDLQQKFDIWTGQPVYRRPAAPKTDTGRKVTPESKLMADQPNIVLSRDEARALGLKVFRTGKPCKHGHTGFRYVSTKGCIKCLKENN